MWHGPSAAPWDLLMADVSWPCRPRLGNCSEAGGDSHVSAVWGRNNKGRSQLATDMGVFYNAAGGHPRIRVGRHRWKPPSRSAISSLLALQRTLLEAIPKDLSRPWEDPLPEQGERHLAQELRGIGLGGYEVPEWKQQALGKVRAPCLAL